jgi:hypothetical protein
MEKTHVADVRIRARDRALSLLNNMTAGIAFAAVAGVGIFGAVSEMTIPGVSASSSPSSTATSANSSASSASSSSSGGLQSSSGTVSSSSSSPVAVSGGS